MTKKTFIWIGRLEGLSFLILVGVAMPLKYLGDDPRMVGLFGRIHGALFMAYVGSAAFLADRENWGQRKLLQSWVASCLPFGTFWFEKKLLT